MAPTTLLKPATCDRVAFKKPEARAAKFTPAVRMGPKHESDGILWRKQSRRSASSLHWLRCVGGRVV